MNEENHENIGKALGRIASGLFIVSSRFEDQAQGMLGSWVMQAAFEPPMVTVAIKKNRGLRLLIESSEAFTISILGADDGALMKPFFSAPGPGQDQFAGLNTENIEVASDAPVLLDSHAWLACEMMGMMDAGDNVVYLGEVLSGKLLKSAEPKTHVRESGFKY